MIIHFHYSGNPNSGEIRRIRNINSEICSALGCQAIEIEFYSLRDKARVTTDWKFELTNHVCKKYYFPQLPFSGRFLITQLLGDLWTSLCVLFVALKFRPRLIVGEYSVSGVSMLFKKFIKCFFIADMHGALPEEYAYSNQRISNWRLKYLEKGEKRTCDLADYIICQSNEMKRHIVKKYNANSSSIYVYKCGVNTGLFKLDNDIRKQYRKEIGISDDCTLFVYAGGIMKWQKVEESMLMFSEVVKKGLNAHFLILTGEKDKVYSLINEHCLSSIKDKFTVLTSSYDKVPAYLNAADAAFLLRDNELMNQVASPTKLAEYLACGLPVISSDVAKSWVVQEMINDNTIIIVNEVFDSARLVEMVKNVDKKKIFTYAEEHYSLKIDAINIKRLCSLLLS